MQHASWLIICFIKIQWSCRDQLQAAEVQLLHIQHCISGLSKCTAMQNMQSRLELVVQSQP